jgi:hypothetical protein
VDDSSQGAPAQVFHHQVRFAAPLALVQVPQQSGMAQSLTDLCFTLIALADGHASYDIVDRKLEHNLLLHLPILGQVDLADNSSAEGTNDLVVIDAASWLIACWQGSCTFFLLIPASGHEMIVDVNGEAQ